MAVVSVPNVFSVGSTILASEHNANFNTIYDDYGGNISNANIAAAAAITDGKLAQITTASKVSGAALTTLTSVPAGAGLIPGANVFPAGVILLWSGTIATIPTGFVLCDGNNSTPDLTNRFIVGADADDGGVAKSTITGSALASHDTGVMPTHSHAFSLRDSYGTSNIPSRGSTGTNTGATAETGTGTKVISVFYSLAYIMKS